MKKIKLYSDSYIKNRKWVFEYILGWEVDTKLLQVRIFDEVIKKSVYTKQTNTSKNSNESNYPLCALWSDTNKIKIWNFNEMDADHVTAWSKGWTTEIKNCQMLCKTHNKAKGNK